MMTKAFCKSSNVVIPVDQTPRIDTMSRSLNAQLNEYSGDGEYTEDSAAIMPNATKYQGADLLALKKASLESSFPVK